MTGYAAFLRGVSPMNAKMPELVKVFEAAGFTDVRTVLSSGNVVFAAPAAPETALERKAEAAMKRRLGSAFPTIVRPIEALQRMLASDPWGAAFSAYGPSPRGPVFMALIERTFGKEVTTRTWDTVKKVAR
jgi:uncharacterized protein (DUF1697 family)